MLGQLMRAEFTAASSGHAKAFSQLSTLRLSRQWLCRFHWACFPPVINIIHAMAPQKNQPLQIYQLHVTLQNIEPTIFRTVVVTSTTTLRQLHELIQASFGWLNCHLHAFRDQDGVSYSSAQEGMFAMDMEVDDVDDAMIRLDSVLQAKGDRLTYEYDFGDGWEHEIVVVEIGPPKTKGLYPAVIDGARNCPPEDCGGPFGYQELMELVLRKRQRIPLESDEEEWVEWLGDDYDPEAFDLDKANIRIASYGKLS